jgi:hypothetical protein
MKRHFLRSLPISLLLCVFFPTAAFAAFSFPQLSQENLDSIERDFAATTTMHNVLPPSSMGSIFGFELGVVGGLTQSPGINQQVQRVSPSTNAGTIPHAGLVAAVTVPGGITVEGMYLPKLTAAEFSYQQYALALKWTMTDGLFLLPINLAARGFYSKSMLEFSQTLTDPVSTFQVPVNGTNDTAVTGVQLFLSPKLIPIIEPYAGVGLLSANGTLTTSGPTAATLFSFTSNTSASSGSRSTQIFAGVDVRLLLIGLGLEWSRAFDTDSYTAKFSFKF